MNKTNVKATPASAHTILAAFVAAAQERRAEDVRVLDLTEISDSMDYFVLLTATAGLQLNAVAQAIKEQASELGLAPPVTEGPSERWLLLSFGNIIVHLFTRDAREYYDLEGLWSDAQELEFTQEPV